MRRQVAGGRWAESFDAAQARYEREHGSGGGTTPLSVLEFSLCQTLGIPLRDLGEWDEQQRYEFLGASEGKALAEWAAQTTPAKGG